jgi:hypothetical protein
MQAWDESPLPARSQLLQRLLLVLLLPITADLRLLRPWLLRLLLRLLRWHLRLLLPPPLLLVLAQPVPACSDVMQLPLCFNCK